MNAREDQLIEALSTRGYAVVEEWLPESEWGQLARELAQSWEHEKFKPARIGKDAGVHRNTSVRGDWILWLGDQPQSAAQSVFVESLEQLRARLNQEFFLGLKRFEAHFALYPPGAGYDRHLDQHQGVQERAISFVFYLNQGWRSDEGGELCIFKENESEEIECLVEPVGGRLAVFRSDLVWHRVNPSARERRSLTGWFRRDE